MFCVFWVLLDLALERYKDLYITVIEYDLGVIQLNVAHNLPCRTRLSRYITGCCLLESHLCFGFCRTFSLTSAFFVSLYLHLVKLGGGQSLLYRGRKML